MVTIVSTRIVPIQLYFYVRGLFLQFRSVRVSNAAAVTILFVYGPGLLFDRKTQTTFSGIRYFPFNGYTPTTGHRSSLTRVYPPKLHVLFALR